MHSDVLCAAFFCHWKKKIQFMSKHGLVGWTVNDPGTRTISEDTRF